MPRLGARLSGFLNTPRGRTDPRVQAERVSRSALRSKGCAASAAVMASSALTSWTTPTLVLTTMTRVMIAVSVQPPARWSGLRRPAAGWIRGSRSWVRTRRHTGNRGRGRQGARPVLFQQRRGVGGGQAEDASGRVRRSLAIGIAARLRVLSEGARGDPRWPRAPRPTALTIRPVTVGVLTIVGRARDRPPNALGGGDRRHRDHRPWSAVRSGRTLIEKHARTVTATGGIRCGKHFATSSTTPSNPWALRSPPSPTHRRSPMRRPMRLARRRNGRRSGRRRHHSRGGCGRWGHGGGRWCRGSGYRGGRSRHRGGGTDQQQGVGLPRPLRRLNPEPPTTWKEPVVPTLSQRVRAFLSSPRGKRLIEQGQRQLAKPENQQKARKMLDKLRGGRARGQ